MVKKKANEPRLTIELVPRFCWGRNLRNMISKEQWTELRKIREAFSGKCAICGNGDSDSPLHLHEVWHYDDRRGLQELVDLQPICSDCHDVKHFGRATKVVLVERGFECRHVDRPDLLLCVGDELADTGWVALRQDQAGKP